MMDATFFLRALLPGFSGRDVCPFCDLFNSLTLSFLFLFFCVYILAWGLLNPYSDVCMARGVSYVYLGPYIYFRGCLFVITGWIYLFTANSCALA